jgi:hypothetical protein
VESILFRAEHLHGPERALMEAVFRDGKPLRALAALLSTNERALGRRVHRIAARVLAPSFAYVARCAPTWPEPRRTAALLLFVHGWSIRRVAGHLNQKFGAVRRLREALEAAGAQQASPTGERLRGRGARG